MTKKEVKDEMKDTEGRPEVKSHIRKRQREMASARMIEKVKDADVVITNPEHFLLQLHMNRQEKMLLLLSQKELIIWL